MKITAPVANRMDSGETAFFERELDFVKAKTYDQKLKPLKALTGALPIDSSPRPGDTTVTWRRFNAFGLAKFLSTYAEDLPRVDVSGEENTTKIYPLGDMFGYSIKEIRSSMQTGKGLDVKKAVAARTAIEQKLNKTGFLGAAEVGLYGIINSPGNTNYTVPNDGTGSSKLWTTKTPDQIIRDLSGLISAVLVPTNGVEIPDTIALPLAQYTYIAQTRMGTVSDKTILQYFRDSSPDIKNVVWWPELDGAGASGTDRMMAYVNDPNNLEFVIPQAFEQMAPQQKGLEFEVPCQAETAGVLVFYPLSIAFGDGI